MSPSRLDVSVRPFRGLAERKHAGTHRLVRELDRQLAPGTAARTPAAA